MSDTDIYRVMYKHKSQPDKWRHFISRSNGEGFYVRLTSAQNAIKQIDKWTDETKIQHLESTPVFLDEEGYYTLEWVDVDA